MNNPMNLNPIEKDNVSAALLRLNTRRLVCDCGSNAFAVQQIVGIFSDRTDPSRVDVKPVGNGMRCAGCNAQVAFNKETNAWEFPGAKVKSEDEEGPKLELL